LKYRVSGDRQQRVGDGFEQQVVNEALVLIGDSAQRFGQREHHVEVRDRQQIRLAGFAPAFGATGLTLRAMPVAAGVIGKRVRVALRTVQPMAAEFRRSAAFDRRQGLELPETQMTAVSHPIVSASGRDDVGDLKLRPPHLR
jgi:hypothetical protein